MWGLRSTAMKSPGASPEELTEQRISALVLEAGLDAFGVCAHHTHTRLWGYECTAVAESTDNSSVASVQ
jgi:hypothetical protein